MFAFAQVAKRNRFLCLILSQDKFNYVEIILAIFTQAAEFFL